MLKLSPNFLMNSQPHLSMKKTLLPRFLFFVTLLIAVPHTDAATLSFDEFNLEDIKDSGDTKKSSKEVTEAFRLSKSGLQEQAFKMFTLAAKRNEVTAFMALGIMHREGRGTPQNLKLAKDNFQKAATKGSKQAREELVLLRFAAPDNLEEFAAARKQIEELASSGMAVAQLRLGMAHLAGYGYTADAAKAIDYLTQATKSTGPFKSDAAFALGQLYRDGKPKPEVKPDALSAESWFKKAAEAKHPGAMRALGEFYLVSDPAQQNFASAQNWFSRLDQLGDPYGTYYLGQMSENGWGGEKSLESAVNYYRKAADKKVPAAIYRLATFHENGLGGLKKDKNKAIDHYRQGAELGHPFCMYNLSIMLDTMDEKPQLKAEVMPWLLRSAAAGLVEAEYQIGQRYQQGRGVQQDFVASAAWFNRAALSGHAQGQLHLGEMYEKGQGVKLDHGAARQLFELSAKGSNFGGVIKYAEVLAKGIGGKQDLAEAYVYAESAATAAVANANASNAPLGKLAIQLRDGIIKIMTAEQLAEGEKRLAAAKKAAAKND
jgi:TPR repeat protein